MSTLFQTLPTGVLDGVGMLGFVLYVLNYLALTCEKTRSDSVAYFATNGVAALMVLVGLSSSFNLASAMIQIFWIGISALAIFIRLRRPAQADEAYSTGIQTVTVPRPVATSNR